MVLPALAHIAGHALCGVAMNTTCDECMDCFDFNISNGSQEKDQNEDGHNHSDHEGSNRTLLASNKPKPTGALNQRQDSVTLFAKKITTTLDPETVDEDEEEADIEADRMNRKTIVRPQRDGDDSVIEIDFEGTSTVQSNQIISGKSEHFVNGDFYNGKIREIETPQNCYNIKFNLDSTILAIGLDNNGGVLLYETTHFSLLTTIEREDSVSALDWVDDPFESDDGTFKSHDVRAQILAVGGFDGVVSMYSIVLGSSTQELVTMMYDVRVKSDVLSMAFVKDNATHYAPFPLALAIGKKNGTVSLFLTDGEKNQFKSTNKMRKLFTQQSAVLTLAFGFVEDGIMIASGTKDGVISVYAIVFHEEEWKLSHLLCEHTRTGAIRALRFNHDSTSLIVGGYDNTLLIIDTHLWKTVEEVPVDGTICTIEYDPYHRYILLGSRSKTLTIIDTSTFHPIKSIQVGGWVSCVTWGGDSIIALRSDDKAVSLINLEPIQSLGLILESSRGEEIDLSWSYDGRFLARTYGNDVIINDSKREFEEVTRLGQNQPVRGVSFCTAEGKRERIAVVGNDGFLRIFQLRISVGKVHVEPLASIYLEQNLWAVGWSTDGDRIIAGGKGALLHFICTKTFRPLCEPRKTGGTIKTIDALSEKAQSELGDYSLAFSLAVSVGQNYAQIYDMNTFESSMQITRKRTVRCLRYHPTLPILAVGDGSNEIVIVDLVGERRIASFSVDGRVNSIDFSPSGDFIAVGSDSCVFTIHEINTFKIVQEIPANGFAMSLAFSGNSGQYLALAQADGETDIIQLGPLLSINYIALGPSVLELPPWALNESIYRSPQGLPLLQRCMFAGSKESLMCAAKILKEAPSTVLTFDRSTGMGCFETVVLLRKPNIIQLILNTLVDGTLESQNKTSSSVLTSTMPIDGFLALRHLILHHPPGYATDVLSKMTFVKVPFVDPISVRFDGVKECGSFHYTNPWSNEMNKAHLQQSDENPKDLEVLVPAVLPFPGLGTLDFLSALIAFTGPDVFDNDAMGLVLVVMWDAGVKRYFLIDFLMNVIFCVIWVLFVDRTSANTADESNALWGVTSLAWATLLLNVVFIVIHIIRIFGRQQKLFRSSWHIIDIISILLVFVYTILVFILDREDNSFFYVSNSGKGHVTLGVATTLFLTTKFISLLRGFDRTGWLVAVLAQNFLDVRGFIVVIVSILFGFTIAFRLLFADVGGSCVAVLDEDNNMENDCDEDPFGSLAKSLLSTFELAILGSYESSMVYESNDAILSAIVFVIAVTVILVVALNALIAVLGDSFSRVQENVVANRRRERAELIVEYLSLMPTSQRKKIESNNQYFHALLASDGHGDLLVHKDEWQGGLDRLKQELTELTETNNQMTHQAINQLREELREEVTLTMRKEVGAILKDILMEVKAVSKTNRANVPKGKKVLNVVQTMQKNFSPLDGIQNGIQRNLAPLDGLRQTLMRPLPMLLPNRGAVNRQTTNQRSLSEGGNRMAVLEETDIDGDGEDFPNLRSSATFG